MPFPFCDFLSALASRLNTFGLFSTLLLLLLFFFLSDEDHSGGKCASLSQGNTEFRCQTCKRIEDSSGKDYLQRHNLAECQLDYWPPSNFFSSIDTPASTICIIFFKSNAIRIHLSSSG